LSRKSFVFSLAVDVAWQYRLTSLDHNIEESFSSFGSEFTIEGVPMSRNSVDGVVNFSYLIAHSWTIYAEAAGQRWSNDSSYSLLGGITFSW